MVDFQAIDPLSDRYVLPKARTPQELVRLLLARQRKVFDEIITETHPELTIQIMQHNMGKLVEKYGVEDVLRGIELSVLRGEHPGSTAFIEEQIKCQRELKSCPQLKAFVRHILQNKS